MATGSTEPVPRIQNNDRGNREARTVVARTVNSEPQIQKQEAKARIQDSDRGNLELRTTNSEPQSQNREFKTMNSEP